MKHPCADHTGAGLAGATKRRSRKREKKEECISKDKKLTTRNGASQIDTQNVIIAGKLNSYNERRQFT